MASPVGAYGEALSVTMRTIDRRTYNLAERKHAMYDLLKGNFKNEEGTEEMDLAVVLGNEKEPVPTDSYGTVVPTASDDIIASAKYQFAGIDVGQVTIPYLDLVKNMGRNRIVDRLKVHQDSLIDSFINQFTVRMHTAHADLPLGSFLSLDSLTNADVAVVGGIDSSLSANANWRPLTATATGDPKQAIRKFLRAQMKRSGKRFTHALVGDNLWDAALEYNDDRSGLQSVGGESVEWEWESIKFGGLELRNDWEMSDPSVNHFVSPEALYFRYLEGHFMKAQEPIRVYKTVGGVVSGTLTMSYPVMSILSVGTNARKDLGQLKYTA